jgi:hypothetical protein
VKPKYWEKTYLSAILFTRPIWNTLGLNMGLCGEKPVYAIKRVVNIVTTETLEGEELRNLHVKI